MFNFNKLIENVQINDSVIFLIFGICILGGLLILLGLIGIIMLRRNVIMYLISNEIFLLGIIFELVFYGFIYNDITPYVVALLLLVIAAAETAIILVILVDSINR
jgi:NADH:ubiquinone oxidoreductase subunit K